MKEVILQDPEINALLTDEDMDMLDHPEQYTGLAAELVQDSITALTSQRENDPETLHR